MELVNDFTVNVPVDEAWKTLTDVERIAPCLPGAQLQEIEGDVYRGVVKVKVGPILAQFKGQATFLERDETNHRAVLKAEGRDTGGKGNASALDHGAARLGRRRHHEGHGHHRPHDHGQGRPVRPGRAGRREHQAAEPVRRPARDDRAPPATRPTPRPPAGRGRDRRRPAKEAATASNNGDPAVRKVEHVSADPVDLVDVAGGAVLKRLAPLAVIGLIVVLILLARRRRGS